MYVLEVVVVVVTVVAHDGSWLGNGGDGWKLALALGGLNRRTGR
jgi:hypothetical protein